MGGVKGWTFRPGALCEKFPVQHMKELFKRKNLFPNLSDHTQIEKAPPVQEIERAYSLCPSLKLDNRFILQASSAIISDFSPIKRNVKTVFAKAGRGDDGVVALRYTSEFQNVTIPCGEKGFRVSKMYNCSAPKDMFYGSPDGRGKTLGIVKAQGNQRNQKELITIKLGNEDWEDHEALLQQSHANIMGVVDTEELFLPIDRGQCGQGRCMTTEFKFNTFSVPDYGGSFVPVDKAVTAEVEVLCADHADSHDVDVVQQFIEHKATKLQKSFTAHWLGEETHSTSERLQELKQRLGAQRIIEAQSASMNESLRKAYVL